MLKIMGSDICPDCVALKKQLDADQIPYQYQIITKNTANLKDFLRLRDFSPIFEQVREQGGIGIPFLIFDDGHMTLDASEVLFRKYGIRRMKEEDLCEVREVLNQGRNFLQKQGIEQWLNGYPQDDILMEDIRANRGFVLAGDKIQGVLVVDLEPDEEFESCQASFRSQASYGSLHRLAVSDAARGNKAGEKLLRFAQEYCLLNRRRYMRADTKDTNVIMRHLLEKVGFESCGEAVFPERGNSSWILYDKFLRE